MGKTESREDQRRLESLAANVARLMAAADLSLRDLSKEARVPRATLSRLLRAEGVPTLGHVCRLAEFFGRSVEELTRRGGDAETRGRENGERGRRGEGETRGHGDAEPQGGELTPGKANGYNPGKMITAEARDQKPEIQDETLGEKIRRIRKEQGLTLVELAEKVGITHPALSQIEHDQYTPRPRTLTCIALALGIGVGELSSIA